MAHPLPLQERNIVNFGEYAPLSDTLREGLEEAIIFAENTSKNSIPNGAVFMYDDMRYKPEILLSDVGCGITGAITKGFSVDEANKKDMLQAVNELGTHIGQGNHFIDFTTAHPSIRPTDNNSGMLFIHSDFNNKNTIPQTYQQATALQQQAKEKRIEYITQLSKLLGINSEIYHDWTHNSVQQENGHLVYRKGAIDLRETQGIGLLAINPVDGLFLYAAEFPEFHSSMQHGAGRIGSKQHLWNTMNKTSVGMARGYSVPRQEDPGTIIEGKAAAFDSIDRFLELFGDRQSQIGYCVPKLVVTTKNYAASK